MPERRVLTGRIVTMDATNRIVPRGALYLDGQRIVAITPTNSPPPAGFEQSPRLATRGTIYPGLIELHNHLSYNVLPLWRVPRRFVHRDQWASTVAKRQLISGPMELLVSVRGYTEAIVRYAECKCLLGGVTATQGMTLAKAPGIARHYRGLVRNVEAGDDATLPEAGHKIADVDDATGFLRELNRWPACFLLHLSEGLGATARKHFLNLRLPDGRWAITPALAGIHSTGLLAEDLAVLGQHGGAMIWSPLSNLLLYGGTADVKAAKQHGLMIGLGADWSPSGSKNLLGELKVAKLFSEHHGGLFSDRELVAMATINGARILKWQQQVGSLEPGKRADLLVVAGTSGDAYAHLLASDEADISLVMIDGVPRFGTTRLMGALGITAGETLTLGGPRRLNLTDSSSEPLVAQLSLAEARRRLTSGLSQLPHPQPIQPPIGAPGRRAADDWRLVLDNDGLEAASHRALAPQSAASVRAAAQAAAIPLDQLVRPIALDELTVAEEPAAFLDRLVPQPNLPPWLSQELPALYGR
jgi:hypothetical protein